MKTNAINFALLSPLGLGFPIKQKTKPNAAVVNQSAKNSVPTMPSVGIDLAFKGSKGSACDLLNISNLPDPCSGRMIISKHEYENINWPGKKYDYTARIFADEVGKDIKPEEREYLDSVIKTPSDFETLKLSDLIKRSDADIVPKRLATYSQKKYFVVDQTNTEGFLNIGKKYQKSMFDVESNVFQELCDTAEKYPGSNLNDLFYVMRNNHIGSLKKKQLPILGKIYQDIKKSNMPNREELFTIIRKHAQFIKNDSSNAPFRKKIFNAEMRDCFNNFINEQKSNAKNYKKSFEAEQNINAAKKSLRSVEDIMHEFPIALNDEDAFIIKYAGRKAKNNQFYTPKELIERFISPAKATIEHIIPLSPLQGDPKGRDLLTNYLIESAGVNNRRGSIPFWDLDKLYPDMPKNSQKNIDRIIELLNAGKLPGYGYYPKAMKQVLFYATKGRVKLDISALSEEFKHQAIPPEEVKFINMLKKTVRI
jgi:hypothetical protein